MAEARRRHFHQDFAAPWGAKVELDDLEGLRLGVWRRQPGLAKDGGFNAHISGLELELPDAGR
jgi:hypothetical protein